MPGVQGVTGQGVARGQGLARNHSKKGKKRSDVKVLSGDEESIGVITGSYGVNQKEQEHLQNAAKHSAKTQDTMKRYRLRHKTQVTQVKEETKAARPEHSAAKRRAEWGTAGTFCGRRPPQDPEAAEEFCAIRDAYHEMYGQTRGRRKINDSNDCKPSPCEYLSKMKTTIADLKDLHPGRPTSWYVQEAQKHKALKGSHSKTKTNVEKEGTKEKKAKKAKKTTKVKEVKEDKEDKEEKVTKVVEDMEDKEENEKGKEEEDNEYIEGEYCLEEGEEEEVEEDKEEQVKSDEDDNGEKVKKEEEEIGGEQHIEGMYDIGEEEGIEHSEGEQEEEEEDCKEKEEEEEEGETT